MSKSESTVRFRADVDGNHDEEQRPSLLPSLHFTSIHFTCSIPRFLNPSPNSLYEMPPLKKKILESSLSEDHVPHPLCTRIILIGRQARLKKALHLSGHRSHHLRERICGEDGALEDHGPFVVHKDRCNPIIARRQLTHASTIPCVLTPHTTQTPYLRVSTSPYPPVERLRIINHRR